MNVTLYISDDQGHNYVSAGSIELTEGDYFPALDWRSLGSMHAPGRLFKVEDFGALARIDGMDMPDDETA